MDVGRAVGHARKDRGVEEGVESGCELGKAQGAQG
jgi:hypothetical protein